MTAIQAPLMSNPLTSLSLAPTTLPATYTTADVLDASGNALAPQEGDALIAGQLSSSDLDNNATASYSLIGAAIPGLTINSDGSWSFNPADSAYNDLSEGELKTITVDYSVTDDQNAVDTGSFNISLTGTNDAPEATYTTDLSVLEGATDSSGNTLNLTGQLTATDIDSDASGLTFSLVDASGAPTTIDGLTLNSDGSFSFDPTNSAYDSLADGQSEVITVNYQVNDGDSGTSDVQSFDITVLGTNDAPTATYTTADVLDASGNPLAPQEGDALIAGQLSSSDLDNNATASYSLIGAAIPGLTINTDGSWSFNPADSAYNDLSEGELKTITVDYSVTDDQNAVDTGSFSINLTGTNDAPEATYTTDLSVLEGATDSSGNTLNLTGQLTATDIDSDASGLTFSLVDASGAPTSIDGLTLNSDGSFSFDPTNSAYDSLADGQSEVITVNYQVNDGDSGTSDVQSFDITVLGTNDAPTATYTTADVLDASGLLAPQEGDALIAGQLSSSDLDNNATASTHSSALISQV